MGPLFRCNGICGMATDLLKSASLLCFFSLQMSFLCTFAVICLASGVMAQMYHEPTIAHIRVYAPPDFLKYAQEVYVTRGRQVNVTSRVDRLTVHHYGGWSLVCSVLWEFIASVWLRYIHISAGMKQHNCIIDQKHYSRDIWCLDFQDKSF